MKIAIIGAFEEEITKLLEIFDLKKDPNTLKNVYLGNYLDKSLIVARSGIGKVNSGAMTQYIIDTYKPDLIINSGCAGSLRSDIKIMDVVISTYVTYHDFKPLRIMNFSVPDNGHIIANNTLIKIAEEAIGKLENEHYHLGAICSGDSFVTNEKMRDQIREETGASAVDMESGSIGHICRLNNIPFVSIRTISDFADGNDDFEELAAYKSSSIVNEMIKLL